MKKFVVSTGDRKSNVQLLADGRVFVDDTERSVEWISLSQARRVLRIDGRSFDVDVVSVSREEGVRLLVNGFSFIVHVQDERSLLLQRLGFAGSIDQRGKEIKAPMPGLITKVMVQPGDIVEAGQGVIVLEAMKMENELTAPSGGTVKTVHVTEREAVDKNAILIELE